MTKPTKQISIVKFFSDDVGREKLDEVAVEEPLEISIKMNDQIHPVSVTMRTPGDDGALAIGFLWTEGILKSPNQFSSNPIRWNPNSIIVEIMDSRGIDLKKLKRNFYTTSSCGVCGKESIEAIHQAGAQPASILDNPIDKSIIFGLPEKLKEAQKNFDATGGIHASALFDLEGNLLYIKEDVGRHNALDKLIGQALMDTKNEEFGLKNTILMLSGRASFELIQKAAMANIPVICAIGAPSSLAIETACKFGITLIGFLKNNSANIYSESKNILI